MAGDDVVRIRSWADSGPTGGFYESDAPLGATQYDCWVFEVPRELWERYTDSKAIFDAAEEEIIELEMTAMREAKEAKEWVRGPGTMTFNPMQRIRYEGSSWTQDKEVGR